MESVSNPARSGRDIESYVRVTPDRHPHMLAGSPDTYCRNHLPSCCKSDLVPDGVLTLERRARCRNIVERKILPRYVTFPDRIPEYLHRELSSGPYSI